MKKYLKFIIYKHYILQSCNKKIQVFPPQLQPELLNMITRENNQLNKYSSMNEPKDTANSKSPPPDSSSLSDDALKLKTGFTTSAVTLEKI